MKYSLYALFTACLLVNQSLSAMDKMKIVLLSEERLENIEIDRVTRNGVPLIQLKSLNQFTTKGSSSASCAYHGLRNTCVVAKGAQHPKTSVEEVLFSQEHMSQILGPNGLWRKKMQDMRGGTNGDWLDAYELQDLIKKVGNESFSNDFLVGIYGHILKGQFDPHKSLEQNSVQVKEFLSQRNEFFDSLIEQAHSRKDFVGGVLIYVELPVSLVDNIIAVVSGTLRDWLSLATWARVYRSQQNLHGHWIALVVVSAQGEHQYMVLDSAGNVSRLNDKKVDQVLMLVENKRWDEMPTVPAAYTKEAARLATLHKEVSIEAFEQEREILGRIEALEQYKRSKYLLTTLVVLAGIYWYYHRQSVTEATEYTLDEILPAVGNNSIEVT